MQTLSVEVSARRIATVTLNRPNRGNAFDQAILDGLARTFASLAVDDGVRVVVLRGQGRHFCAGADLVARSEEPISLPPTTTTLFDVLLAIDGCPKPTVAVVQGGAIGGGAAFAACCDVVLAASEAFFSIPEVRVGMAGLGVAPFLIRAMGHRSFRRYGLSGERIAAADALRLGLAHEVCDADRLDETLVRITDELLHGAPGAIAELKAATALYACPSLATITTNRPAHPAARSPEAIEGIASFRQKRKPSWYPR